MVAAACPTASTPNTGRQDEQEGGAREEEEETTQHRAPEQRHLPTQGSQAGHGRQACNRLPASGMAECRARAEEEEEEEEDEIMEEKERECDRDRWKSRPSPFGGQLESPRGGPPRPSGPRRGAETRRTARSAGRRRRPRGSEGDLDRAELKGPPPDCLLARGWRNQVHGQAPASRCLAHVVVHLRVLSTASSSSSSCLARPAADLGTDGLGPPIAEDVARLGRRPRGLPAGRRAPGHGAARRAPRAASEPCRTDLHMTSSASGTGHANQQPGRRPRCAASRSAAAAARSAPGQPKRREALRPGAAHSAGRGAASAEACAPR
ncbi:unnamed protein product, partial [Prorocentrum cordatum]